MLNFWRVPLTGEQPNPASRQYTYRFPDSRTVFRSNPENTLPDPDNRELTQHFCTLWYSFSGYDRIMRAIRELTQQDGWNTQDGTMTKRCRIRLGMYSLAPHFFVILPSWVFQPSCCVEGCPTVLDKDGCVSSLISKGNHGLRQRRCQKTMIWLVN